MSKKNKKHKSLSKKSLVSSTSKQVKLFENLCIYGLITSVFFMFSMQVNNHFALPKLAPIVLFTILLLSLFILQNRQNYIANIPRVIWVSLLGLVVWWLLGTNQAMHIKTALEGQVGRYNGLYTHLTLVILFLVTAQMRISITRAKKILNVFYATSFILCLHAISQYFNFDPILNVSTTRPFATIGNPVALAVINIMLMPFVLIEAFETKNQNKKLFLFVLLSLLVFTLVITGSRGPWLAFLVSSLVLLLFFRKSILKIKTIPVKHVSLLLILVFTISYFAIDWAILADRLTLAGAGFKLRIIYFSAAFEFILEHPVIGAGFESFRHVYPAYRPIEDVLIAGRDVTSTMVHNDFLQLAVDNGVPAFIFFITFVTASLWTIVRVIKQKPEHSYFLIAIVISIIAYLAQSMTGWLEIASFFMFWFILGLGVSVASQTSMEDVITKPNQYRTHFAIGCILFLVFYTSQIFNYFDYEKTARKMQAYHIAGRQDETNKLLTTLNKITSDSFYYQDKIGGIYLDRLSSNKAKDEYTKQFYYSKAHEHFTRAQELNPFNAYIKLNLMNIDTIAMHQGLIRKPSQETIANIVLLSEMDPNNPTVYEMRARLYGAMGDREKQLIDIVKARTLLKHP
jgi:O-antigen ligase